MAGTGGPAEPSHLAVGHVTKPHGTKGEVFVWPLTDEPDAVFVEGRILRLRGEGGEPEPEPGALEIERVRPFKRGLLVAFRGRSDRNAVEALAGRYLLAGRDALTPPAADEVWYHQLLGVAVVTAAGEALGKVVEVFEAQPADLIEVERPDGRRFLVPATRNVVSRIEPGVRLIVDPPAGLLDL